MWLLLWVGLLIGIVGCQPRRRPNERVEPETAVVETAVVLSEATAAPTAVPVIEAPTESATSAPVVETVVEPTTEIAVEPVAQATGLAGSRPNVILLMTDDQGWGETGYYGHPLALTPNLDEMAASGLVMNRFYATAPICSPTRVSILTGRHHYRSGCFDVMNCTLDKSETTIAEELQGVGYATGHFGKWHIGRLSGGQSSSPGDNGFEQWVSARLFYDLNSDIFVENGQSLPAIPGDGSDFVVDEALEFIEQQVADDQPFFVVIWYAAPHTPWEALESDKAMFAGLTDEQQNYYGELYAMDRSIGTLRQGLRDFGIADETVVWFNSDNGPFRSVAESATGGLQGSKSSLWEGGIRVPAVVEWPNGIATPLSTDVAASTLDIYPTILELAGLTQSSELDGISLLPMFGGNMTERVEPIPFWYERRFDGTAKCGSGNGCLDAGRL